jgi:uncharacterized protein (DUF4415 family)
MASGKSCQPISPDLLESLRATGPGWQARLDASVREWLDRSPS